MYWAFLCPERFREKMALLTHRMFIQKHSDPPFHSVSCVQRSPLLFIVHCERGFGLIWLERVKEGACRPIGLRVARQGAVQDQFVVFRVHFTLWSLSFLYILQLPEFWFTLKLAWFLHGIEVYINRCENFQKFKDL